MFWSVSFFPSASVIVSSPPAYSPPAIPISTDLPFLAILTRTKVGSSFGNEPSTATSSATPLTEIEVAAATSGASGVEPPVVKPPSAVPPPSAALSAGFASFFVSTGSFSVPSFGSETRAGPGRDRFGLLRERILAREALERGELALDGLGREIGVGDRRELRLSRGRDRLATRGRPTGCGRDARRRRRGRSRGRRGDGLRALQHLQRLRALEAEQREQKDGASDRDLLLLGRFRLQWIDALRHQPVASLPVASVPAGGASVVVAGGVAAGGGTAPPAALSP